MTEQHMHMTGGANYDTTVSSVGAAVVNPRLLGVDTPGLQDELLPFSHHPMHISKRKPPHPDPAITLLSSRRKIAIVDLEEGDDRKPLSLDHPTTLLTSTPLDLDKNISRVPEDHSCRSHRCHAHAKCWSTTTWISFSDQSTGSAVSSSKRRFLVSVSHGSDASGISSASWTFHQYSQDQKCQERPKELMEERVRVYPRSGVLLSRG